MGNSTKKPTDSASRQERKAKKRKLEDAIADLPGDADGGLDLDGDKGGVELGNLKKEDGEERSVKRVKKDEGAGGKREKKKHKAGKADKRKVETVSVEEGVDGEESGVNGALKDILGEADEPKKSKKERKAERKAALAKEKATTAGTATEGGMHQGDTEDAAEGGEAKVKAKQGNSTDVQNKTQKNNLKRDQKRAEKAVARAAAGGDARDSRFIVFVGNLPFTATTASITKHFAAVKPKSVRHLTQKDDPTKSKGCAFVEFEGYDHMKTALRLFHHSMFEDGKGAGRKINVELTAGGGGNTKDRRSKIEQKNAKLNDERTRRIQEEEKAKWAKKKDVPVDESGIHPSRRTRVPGV